MTKNDYISRPKMLSELRGGFFPQDVVYTEAVAIAKQIIESAPAEEDVVKVVRCKGCKHSTWSQEPCHGKVEYRCKLHGFAVDKHFYCASGERRDQT